MGKRLTGPGGFIDITAATPKVIFAGTLMGKAKVKVGGGKLEIVEEGTIQKFVEKVGQRSEEHTSELQSQFRPVCAG